MTTTLPNDAPLEHFRITGIQENWLSIAPGQCQPGGSCWHCGTGIAVEVLAQHRQTGEVVTIGTTCAERIGLDPEGLKRYLRGRFAQQRAERSAANAEQRRLHAEWLEAEATGKYGEHGTLTRYEGGSGCGCDLCCRAFIDSLPHGEIVKFRDGCRCLDCLDAAVASSMKDPRDGHYRYRTLTVLVDVQTGEIVTDARIVDTRYGPRWRSDARNVWLPLSPKRRSTLADKGYVEAEAEYLVNTFKAYIQGHRQWTDAKVKRVSDPIFDAWGQPIGRAA